jgi:integrase
MPQTREPRLLDRVRTAIRVLLYSRRTEKAYVGWIRQREVFGLDIGWPGEIARAKRPERRPVVLTAEEVRAFLQRTKLQRDHDLEAP